MHILIGGDIAPTKSNFEFFNNGNSLALVDKSLLSILNKSDFRIFNLETPLSDVISPIEKSGPCLIAPTKTINGIKALGANLLGVANNHIFDQGEQGLFSTIKVLNENHLSYTGISKNLEEASLPYIFTLAGLRIGVYACAEHEFSIAGVTRAGANPFDPLESPDHICTLKAECDYVIVLYHGGREHYRYPSPYLQKVCRKLIGKGADIVVTQHSHCIGCEEKYMGGVIIYGQGNFLFDHSDNEFWQTGLLIDLEINDRKHAVINYIPLRKNKNSVKLADPDDARIILADFVKRSTEIRDSDFILSEYHKIAMATKKDYLRTCLGKEGETFLFRLTNKLYKGKYLDKLYDREHTLRILNCLRCEAHREIFMKGLE